MANYFDIVFDNYKAQKITIKKTNGDFSNYKFKLDNDEMIISKIKLDFYIFIFYIFI